MKNVFNQLIFYLLYLVLSWLIYVVFISTSTFIHFLIGHKINIIEDWIFENGWGHVLLAKFIALVFFVKFVEVYQKGRWPFKSFFLNSIERKNKNGFIYILIVFSFFIAVIFSSKMIPQMDFGNKSGVFTSYISIVLYLFFDVVLLLFMKSIWGNSQRLSWPRDLACMLMFYFFERLLFPHSSQSLIYFVFNFYFILRTFDFLLGGVLFLFLVSGPLGVFLNLNPLFRQTNLYEIIPSEILTNFHYLFLVGLIFIYKKYCKNHVFKTLKGDLSGKC